MKQRAVFIIALSLMALAAFGRMIKLRSISELTVESKLAFVGRVEAIKPSGITTHLSYPTWENVTFSWLTLEVEVIEPVKGVQKGDMVQTMALSIGGASARNRLINAPGTLDPHQGDMYLFFLGPTPITNAFAALTAPYDDNQSIFLLDRNNSEYSFVLQSRKEGQKISNVYDEERYDVICSLVSESKELLPAGAEQLRKKYAKEIQTASSNSLIYLEWESYTNAHGWFSDIPKGYLFTNSSGAIQSQTNSAE